MNRFTLLACFLLVVSGTAVSQSTHMPTTHEVYPFLKRMEAKQLLKDYRDAALPLSRRQLAKNLLTLDSKRDSMTRYERREYEFLKEEFQYEITSLQGDPEPSEIRWHLLSQPITDGILNLDFNYAIRYQKSGDDKINFRGQGLKISGYAFKDVGFYFNWVDYRESGSGLDAAKLNTPDKGVVTTKNIGDVIEYNNIDAQLSYQLGSFELSIEKLSNQWGFGRNGRVIFSDKAPSYPQIKMRVPLSNSIDFVYFHAELNSNVLDSARSYRTYSSSLADYFRPVNRPKFLAAHQLEFTPWDGVDISIGESIVYSDRGPLFLYLIPVMFFKAGEHYNKDPDNTQVFGSIDLNVINNVNMYFSFLIDEINTDDFLDPNKSRKQVGITLGFQTYDVLMRNLDFTFEYSRLNPWVYSHRYTAANFTSNGYDLGHWVGQNGDDLFLDLSYAFSRELRIGGGMEFYRKGGKLDVSYQYGGTTPDFLYAVDPFTGLQISGPERKESSIRLHGTYQPLRDLFVEVQTRWLTIEDKFNPSLDRKNQFEFSIGAKLGVW